MRVYLPNDLLKRADADLSDLTASEQTGEPYWDEGDMLVIPFDKEPTEAEQEAIRRRLTTLDAEDEARLYTLLNTRESTTSTFEELWLDEQLSRYGEMPPKAGGGLGAANQTS